jgi:ABC-type multidrug transport system fused ATPase/permease subunit
MKVYRKKIRVAGEKFRASQIGMTKSVNQALGGIKEVKVLQREGYFQRRFVKFSDLFVRAFTQFTVLNSIPKLLIESVCFGGAFILLGLFIFMGSDITGLVPQLSMFVLAAFRLLPAIYKQVGQINQIIYLRPAVDAVYKSLFDDDTLCVLQLPENKGLKLKSNRDIIVQGLTFGYPRSDRMVLENVNLTIPHRKSVAFIGPSGAGKTTLADLILGVIFPQQGGVYYEGNSIHHNFGEWSKNIGYIPQHVYIMDETIRENVAFGIDLENVDDAKVWQALGQAQLKHFVESLPEGLDTDIGDRGIRLSGGQRQRIGIARTMYEAPPILVLDEATSSLDNETEKAVMDAIEIFKGEKTMIIIAHRLSTIEHCDIIYRVEDKKVIKVK